MVLRLVEAQSAPASTAAICAATGLHENTVRGHLEQLRLDGYLRRRRAEITGRGRPAWLWWAVLPDPESPYAQLATVLAESIAATATDPVGLAREAGRRWGRELAEPHDDAESSRELVLAVMREQGYAPVGDGDEMRLCRCPMIEAAAKHREIVCAVHLGMIDGLVESRGDRSESDLHPFTAPAECTLHLRVLP